MWKAPGNIQDNLKKNRTRKFVEIIRNKKLEIRKFLMEYKFREIEQKWQQQWNESGIYKVPNDSSKTKYYVLDMFPYPSGAGLHVGHPLGYIASDIFARYKRLKGFNVLHPMGYDAFGLPAEQYAIEHGIHPAVSTAQNIKNFRSQLDKIGFSFDWSREVNTSDPKYYKWTQWIFLQLFNSWYNRKTNKTEAITGLVKILEEEGNINHPIPSTQFQIPDFSSVVFSAETWKGFSEKIKQTILMEYRGAYCGIGEVNWCEALGTVLANDEVINGVSERGGYPVVKKKLRQWYLRITEYADRLLEGLQSVDFSDAMKEMQSNWIGKSSGAEIDFEIQAPSQPPPAGEEHQHTTPLHYTADPTIYDITKKLSEQKRDFPTHEEELLWQALRNNKTGHHFRRQHIIGSFIVDFVCIDKSLIIEVDGGYHNDPYQKKYDESRTGFLLEKGFQELRVSNEAVRNNIDSVVEEIKQKLHSLPSAHKVSPAGGDLEGASLRVYTTRPDTIFGVDFMVIAPEHELVEKITTQGQKTAVEEYIAYVKSRSERERMAEKKISGVFTGAFAINPFDKRQIPIWISEYVLAGYGTGAIMAVPCGDERDHKFAQHFNISITNIIGENYNGEEANPTKDAILQNSGFINGMKMRDAIEVVITKLEELGIGKRKVNYKMRDAAFSRQRYWGEPFPIIWEDGVAYPLDEKELPLELPYVESYKPGPEGEGPLANIDTWTSRNLETNTMPGYAGSSWYFLRYMDPHNENEFCDKKFSDYWNQVDLYVGGTEHAVGHLLYSRMWTKALYDLGHISFDEPYRKLLNQGMITGNSYFVYGFYAVESTEDYPMEITASHKRVGEFLLSYEKADEGFSTIFEKNGYKYRVEDNAEFQKTRIRYAHLFVDAKNRLTKGNLIKFFQLDNYTENEIEEKLKLVFWDGKTEEGNEYIQTRHEIEKMSKSKFNTVNPDDLVVKYGADTFRMYEMFLGPVEMSKPWDTKGIEGVHRFLKKLWRLFADEEKGLVVTNDAATNAELKVLHKTIKKIEEDTERFSYNTAVSAFMVCVNELTELKCHKKEILQSLIILLTPYAPHISEELWHLLGNTDSILNAAFPKLEEKYLVETAKEYPISINGKLRTQLVMDLNADQKQVEDLVLQNAVVQKWLEGKQPKKIIYVKGKMVNVVI